MKDEIKKVLQNIFTGVDNKTYGFAKFAWFAAAAAIIAVIIHKAWTGQPVDLVAAATAFGIIATAHGAVIWGTRSTEPPAQQNTEETK